MGGWSRENKIFLGLVTVVPLIGLLAAFGLTASFPTSGAAESDLISQAFAQHGALLVGSAVMTGLLQLFYFWWAYSLSDTPQDRGLWFLALWWGGVLGQLAFFALRIWPLYEGPDDRPLLY